MKEQFRYCDDLPRTGWVWLGVGDNDIDNFRCQNCGFPRVRYVHHLKNRRTGLEIRVGCVCAEHLTQDFTNLALREREFKGRASRRLRWPTLNWRRTMKGNLRLRKSGTVVVVVCGKYGGWTFTYKRQGSDWVRGKAWYDTADEAKLSAFDALHPIS